MEVQLLDLSQWLLLRTQLRNNYNYSDSWKTAIGHFRQRIENYYLDPIKKVKDSGNRKGEGFTILTIQCALIEMFAAFKKGKIHNHAKRGPLPTYQYSNAKVYFIDFLQSEPIFENHFYTMSGTRKILDAPFAAKDFYDSVRCGLMHEARTKGSWVINAQKSYSGTERTFITDENGTIRVDRNILNKLLTEYLAAYLDELAEQNQAGERLRRLFARKLDHFFDMPPDLTYDWWEDR